MLWAMIYINAEIIDKLCMWNLNEVNKRGQYKYLVWLESKKPKDDKKHIPKKVVWHKREDGWMMLVTKSLNALQKDRSELKVVECFDDFKKNYFPKATKEEKRDEKNRKGKSNRK